MINECNTDDSQAGETYIQLRTDCHRELGLVVDCKGRRTVADCSQQLRKGWDRICSRLSWIDRYRTDLCHWNIPNIARLSLKNHANLYACIIFCENFKTEYSHILTGKNNKSNPVNCSVWIFLSLLDYFQGHSIVHLLNY